MRAWAVALRWPGTPMNASDQKQPENPAYRATVERERAANVSTRQRWAAFAPHRRVLTEELLAGSSAGGAVCVLGAGNCNDLELTALARHFDVIHLVDLDLEALQWAVRQLPPAVAERVVCHAPLDLAGLLEPLPRWQKGIATMAEFMAHPNAVADRLLASLGRRFQCVVSPCVLTQLHLAAHRELTPAHGLFAAVSYTVTLTHLRTLSALLEVGGRALFASELTASDWVAVPDEEDACLQLLRSLERGGHVIELARPNNLLDMIADDPILSTTLTARAPHRAWPWAQGPERTFLAYALWLERR